MPVDPPQPSRSQKVLIIDDDEAVRATLTEVLTLQKIVTLSTGTALEGLDLAEEQQVDLILLDLGLPDMDGFEVCRQLKAQENTQQIPIILITGRDNTADKVQGFELGVVDYINKPFNVTELRARVSAVLREKEQQDQSAAAFRQERQRTEEELIRISKAVDSASDAIQIVDAQGQSIYQNQAFHLLFQVPRGHRLGPDEHQQLFVNRDTWSRIWETSAGGSSWRGEIEMRTIQGNQVPVLCRADTILDDGGSTLGGVLIFTDITHRKRLESDLIYLANHDPLTNLENRRAFCEKLDDAVAKAQRGESSALLYLDLDNFKIINDTLGHPAGDRLLIYVANLLRHQLRQTDRLARFGGDEFVLLLENTPIQGAVRVAEKLVRLFDEFRQVEKGEFYTTSASIGIAPVNGQANAEELLSQADAACHVAKSRGRNGYFLYRPEDVELDQFTREANWTFKLNEALTRERFELWLQPIIPVQDYPNRHYMEVLLRMRDEQGELIFPATFIPAAERFGKMYQIDEFVLRKAVGFLQAFPDTQLSVNLSAATLTHSNLAPLVKDLLHQSLVDPRRLTLEITETTMITNLSKAQSLIMELKTLGCRFALDDFGAGFSSLKYLRNLPVDILKIDSGFMEAITRDHLNQSLVKSIAEVARVLGKLTVAEGVESSESVKILRRLNIDYAQGFYFQKPRPLSQFPWSPAY